MHSNAAPYGAAFDTGDDPRMVDALGMQTREENHNAGPDRPPSGGNGTHPHGGGGGSNYPFSGWKHYVFGAMHSQHAQLHARALLDNWPLTNCFRRGGRQVLQLHLLVLA